MTTYKLTPNPKMILKDDSLWIPIDPNNTDYQQYLAWIEQGNQPEPAEETQ